MELWPAHREVDRAPEPWVPPSRGPKERALLRVLGFDPDTHGIEAVSNPWQGLRVIGPSGTPVGFFTRRQLKAREREWSRAVRA